MFAVQTDDGTVVFLDEAGNAQVRQSMSSGGLRRAPASGVTTSNDDTRITVAGTSSGNTIHVMSVRPAQ
jgi:hypothetical protein